MSSDLKDKSIKELREIARAAGVKYAGERKKAELISAIRHQQSLYAAKRDPNRKVLGYFLDGSPIYEETPKS
jgi:hypothetical protein